MLTSIETIELGEAVTDALLLENSSTAGARTGEISARAEVSLEELAAKYPSL